MGGAMRGQEGLREQREVAGEWGGRGEGGGQVAGGWVQIAASRLTRAC